MAKYRTEVIRGVSVVKFTKKDVEAYLESCIVFWRNKRDNEPNVKEALSIGITIDAFQAVYKSLFGFQLP